MKWEHSIKLEFQESLFLLSQKSFIFLQELNGLETLFDREDILIIFHKVLNTDPISTNYQ
jgi:hypothetical protein